MTGMKKRSPGRGRRRSAPTTLERLDHATQAVKAATRLMRALTALLWWSTAPLATVVLVVHAVLTGTVAELVDFLIALRPG